MTLTDRVYDDLAHGKMHEAFIEEKRLIAPGSEAVREFEKTMRTIYGRLIRGSGNDPDEHPVRFALSVDDIPNAYIITSAQPPVIVFTTGLVKLADQESELAGVLAHELGHGYFDEQLGDHQIGKIDEGGADWRVPKMLRNANYPQNALSTFFRKLSADENHLSFMLGSPDDPHPAMNNRLEILDLAEVALEEERGEQKASSDSRLDSALKREVSTASFTSFVDRLLGEENFNSADPARQAGILNDIIKEKAQNWDPYFKSRHTDLRRYISGLKTARTTSAFYDLVDTVVKDHVNYERYYTGCVAAASGKRPDTHEEKNKPVGRLQDIQREIDGFVRSGNPGTIQESARDLESLIDQYDTRGSGFRSVAFSGFTWPNNLERISTPQAPPWEAHVQEALNGNQNVLEILERLGIDKIDPRLDERPDTERKGTLGGVSLDLREWRRIGNDSGYYNVNILQDGRIAGLVKAKSDDELAEEQQSALQRISAQREESERRALSSIDWSELGRDFNNFVRTYEKELNPKTEQQFDNRPVAARHTGQAFPFAEAFIQQAASLADQSELKLYIQRQVRKDWANNKVVAAHPYVKYALEHDSFSPDEKISLLTNVLYFDPNPEPSPDSRWQLTNSSLINDLPKTDIAGLRQLVRDLANISPPAPSGNAADQYAPEREVLIDILQYEAYQALRQIHTPVDRNDLPFLREIVNLRGGQKNAIKTPLQEEVSRLTAEHARTTTLSHDINDLVDGFLTLAAERKESGRIATSVFLEQPKLRQDYQIVLKQAITALADPAEKREAFEKLLSSKPLSLPEASEFEKISGIKPQHIYDGSLADPEFKKWVINGDETSTGYPELVAENLRKDDGTTIQDIGPASYEAKFRDRVTAITSKMNTANATIVLKLLSQKKCGNIMQLQNTCATFLEESLTSASLEKLFEYNMQAFGGELAFNIIKSNSYTRDASIDFLTQPFSPERARKFISTINKEASSKLEKPDNKFLPRNVSEEAQVAQMELFHQSFWSWPFELRMVAAQQIIFNTNHRQGADEEARKAAQRYTIEKTLDKVLPHGRGSSKEAKEAEAARNVVESYLEATKKAAKQRLITAAMLVANEPNGGSAGKKLSVGKGLNLVLSQLGPAGDKVKQAIESHPQTPLDIKVEFKESKTAARDPMRHEILKWVDESNQGLAPEQRLTHVGRVLGAGSYGITVEGTRGDGKRIARTLLYPYVRDTAAKEFNTLEKAGDILIGKEASFKPVIQMIRQAKAMSGIETDMEVAAKQAEVAAKLYNGAKVTVDGEEFTFSAAKYMGHGKDHKDFEIIEGQHFNDLVDAAKSGADKERIRKLAKAQMALELSFILSGRPFDHDRHGGQQRIVGNNIGEFDFGAIGQYNPQRKVITCTSDRQKQMIGYVLGGVIRDHNIKGRELDTSMRKQIHDVAETEDEKDFLASIERAILALGNFNSQLGDNAGLDEMLGAVFANKLVDPVIMDAMRVRLKSTAQTVFNRLEAAGADTHIEVKLTEHTFEKSSDTSSLRPPPKESLRERIPLKDEHVQAGAGAAIAAAGAGTLLFAAYKGKKDKQKQTAEDDSQQPRKPNVTRRLALMAGTALTTVGAALTIDGLAFHGQGVKNIVKLAKGEELGGTSTASSGSKAGAFVGVTSVALGAIVLATLITKKFKHKKQDAQDNVSAVTESQKQPDSVKGRSV